MRLTRKLMALMSPEVYEYFANPFKKKSKAVKSHNPNGQYTLSQRLLYIQT